MGENTSLEDNHIQNSWLTGICKAKNTIGSSFDERFGVTKENHWVVEQPIPPKKQVRTKKLQPYTTFACYHGMISHTNFDPQFLVGGCGSHTLKAWRGAMETNVEEQCPRCFVIELLVSRELVSHLVPSGATLSASVKRITRLKLVLTLWSNVPPVCQVMSHAADPLWATTVWFVTADALSHIGFAKMRPSSLQP